MADPNAPVSPPSPGPLGPLAGPTRRRRTRASVAGARESQAIAATPGAELLRSRRALSLAQAELAARVGIGQSRYGDLERGEGADAPVSPWVALGQALRRPLAVGFSRAVDTPPNWAPHLAGQELILKLAKEHGVGRSFELPTRPMPSPLFVDVFLRDDRHRVLTVTEIWNRLDDMGAANRSFQRKLLDAESVAVVAGGDDGPYRVVGCWVVRATAANRALLARYPTVFETQFPGSSRAWVAAFTDGEAPPHEPGLIWIDIACERLFEVRRPDRQPAMAPGWSRRLVDGGGGVRTAQD